MLQRILTLFVQELSSPALEDIPKGIWISPITIDAIKLSHVLDEMFCIYAFLRACRLFL